MTLDRALTWFIWAWISLIVLMNVVAIVGFMGTAPSFWAGVAKIQDTYSPFNVINWLVELVSLSPALGAMLWRDRRRKAAAIVNQSTRPAK